MVRRLCLLVRAGRLLVHHAVRQCLVARPRRPASAPPAGLKRREGSQAARRGGPRLPRTGGLPRPAASGAGRCDERTSRPALARRSREPEPAASRAAVGGGQRQRKDAAGDRAPAIDRARTAVASASRDVQAGIAGDTRGDRRGAADRGKSVRRRPRPAGGHDARRGRPRLLDAGSLQSARRRASSAFRRRRAPAGAEQSERVRRGPGAHRPPVHSHANSAGRGRAQIRCVAIQVQPSPESIPRACVTA